MKRLVVFALAASFGPGCQKSGDAVPDPVEVTGTATLAGGQPIKNVRITLHPLDAKLPPASGRIGEDGTFKLKTVTDQSGVCPGKYAVAFENVGDDDATLKAPKCAVAGSSSIRPSTRSTQLRPGAPASPPISPNGGTRRLFARIAAVMRSRK